MSRLDDVDSSTAKLVLLYLEERGPTASIEDLHEDLGLSRLTLHGVFDYLDDDGVITREGGRVRLHDAGAVRSADD